MNEETLVNDVATLMANIDWSRDKIEKVMRHCNMKHCNYDFILQNLRAISFAMKPETNPKIAPVYNRHRKEAESGS